MRRQSVAFFLGDVGFLSDPKFRKLARRLTDPDDFNSAVGAWFIALAAARRNGLPTVDVASETDSKFVADLVSCGLLTDEGFPEKAFIGWAPSRQPRPSEGGRPASNASSGDENVGGVENVIPSTPLPSTPIEETDDRAREPFDIDLWARLLILFEDLTGKPYVLGSPLSGHGAQVISQVESAGWGAAEAAYRDIAAVYGKPTVRQLVFDAEDRLRPTGKAKPKPVVVTDDPAAVKERERRRQERMALQQSYFRGEMTQAEYESRSADLAKQGAPA